MGLELTKDQMAFLKLEYANTLVYEILNKPDTEKMLTGMGKLNQIDAIFRAQGQRTVITISTEPHKPTDSNNIHQTEKTA